MGICESTAKVGYLVVEPQHLVNPGGYIPKPLGYGLVFRLTDSAFLLANSQRQQREHRHLASEGLGAGHAYLRTHVDVCTSIRGTGDAGGYGITDAVNKSAIALGQFHGSQGIRGLTTLGNSDNHVIGRHHGIAVTELTGVLHLHGYATIVLYQLLAYQARVPRRATSHDNKPFGIQQLVAVVGDSTQHHAHAMVYGHYPSPHAVSQALRLLEYLLEHEVGEAAFLYLSQVQVHGLHLWTEFHVEDIHHLQLFTLPHHGDIPVFQIYHLIGVLNDGTGIRAQEKLAITYAHHEGTLLASGDNLAGLALVNDSDGVSAYHLAQGHLHAGEQVEAFSHLNVFYQLHKYLGVGIALETHALRHQVALDGGIILYDTIVDDNQVVRGGIMGMGIAGRRLTMGGPAGVGDAHAARHVFILAAGLQVGDFALGLVNAQVAIVIDQGHARGIVAPVFQSLESFQQYGEGFSLPQVSYYATHAPLYIIYIYMYCIVKDYLLAIPSGLFPYFNIFTTRAATEVSMLANENHS